MSRRAHLLRAATGAGVAGCVALLGFAAPAARPASSALEEPGRIFAEPSPEYLESLTLAPPAADKLRTEARLARSSAAVAVVGDRRLWPALDRSANKLYVKYFTLRAVGANIEVWVASDQDGISKGLEFPPGDCRNDDRVQLSDAQAQLLAQQFDGTIQPRMAQAFSAPPPRDGTAATLPARSGLPQDYYAAPGNRVVALVDNIRDPTFFDVNVRVGVGGVFVPSLDEQVDRNVITIDGVDWLHRTGASPPHDPVAGDLCRSRAARPFLIEATFAHEYQHLLQSYLDDDEATWVNEGLSMYAEAVTGYVDLRKPITEVGFSGSVQCLLGNTSKQTGANPNPIPGGPENSLTVWGDKGDEEIVCDYGAAEMFMHYLASRLGPGFLTAFHRDPDNGLRSLRKLAAGAGSDVAALLHDWAVMLALDGVLDRGGRLSGGAVGRFRVPTLDAAVNWAAPQSYLRPGAPPNGSDYVRLTGANRAFLPSSQIRSIAFDGSVAFPRRPVEWRVEPNPLEHAGNAAFHSGSGGGLDRGIVRRIVVPRTGATLSFATRYDLSPGLDFAFVQVSTNDGRELAKPAQPAHEADRRSDRLAGRSSKPARPDGPLGRRAAAAVDDGVVRPRRLPRAVGAARVPLRERSTGGLARLVDRRHPARGIAFSATVARCPAGARSRRSRVRWEPPPSRFSSSAIRRPAGAPSCSG